MTAIAVTAAPGTYALSYCAVNHIVNCHPAENHEASVELAKVAPERAALLKSPQNENVPDSKSHGTLVEQPSPEVCSSTG